MSLSKTNIEYGEFNWQIYRGCLHKPQNICPVPNCWAEKVSKRQGWDFHKPELLTKNLLDPLKRKKPARILVNFSGDIFGDWVNPNLQSGDVLRWSWKQDPTLTQGHECVMMNSPLQRRIERIVQACPQHTFLFLTKAPQNIWKIAWPDNCWMGATAWDEESFYAAAFDLASVNAKHKWLSLEPLLGDIGLDDSANYFHGISWVVIGSQSNPDVQPQPEWAVEIIEACDRAGIKVWLKNNLKLPAHYPFVTNAIRDNVFGLRQEFPTVLGLRQEYPRVTP